MKTRTLKRIHIDKNLIYSNLKNGTDYPVVTVQNRGRSIKARTVEGFGKWIISQDAKQLECGARLYIETRSPITIDGKDLE